jgi:putative ABC transport system permease protein
MIKFLLKGVMRDRTRSLFPFLVVFAGVLITVLMHAWMGGARTHIIAANASFSTGHVKVMSRAYAKHESQIPNDLAYIGVQELMSTLKTDFPDMIWTQRIRFGGLLDIPDENGETRSQSPVFGLAVNLLDQQSPELKILNLHNALVQGRLPEKSGEILISEQLAQKLDVKIGEQATLMSSTMYSALSMYNFKVAGTVEFGMTVMDRGAMITDISDIQIALDMHDASGEILGFFNNNRYQDQKAEKYCQIFNRQYEETDDQFAPIMLTLADQNALAELLDMYDYMGSIIVGIFIFIMSIVLWNAGLMGNIRRYGEIGVRMAIGENSGHLYRSLIYESMLIGFFGSLAGTLVGLGIAYYLQEVGIDISAWLQKSTILMTNVVGARITPATYYIGFIPGFAATILGTAISGLSIYKRQTAQLFRELEV